MNYYINVLKNYATFGGRARRKEFWIFTFINLIFALFAMAIDRKLGTCFKMEIGYGVQTLPYGYIFALYCLSTLVPTLALQVRRLHDVGKSGWFFFISFIPIIGSIWLLVLYCTDSDPVINAYGPNPKPED
jgi:uncharacterized membrane protein YhaH (DUF805 family)